MWLKDWVVDLEPQTLHWLVFICILGLLKGILIQQTSSTCIFGYKFSVQISQYCFDVVLSFGTWAYIYVSCYEDFP